jgi:hypothetical protein
MNINNLRAQFPDESACRKFFELINWPNGRRCMHCSPETSYMLSGRGCLPGLFECGG